MKMTNRELITAVNRIENMQRREEAAGEKLFGNKIKINYAIRKNKECFLRLLEPYEAEREALLEACNKKEAQLEGTVDIRKDCKEQWSRGMAELLGIEIDVNVHMIPFRELEGLSLSVSDMEAIDFMVEGPEEFR